ncbi:polyphosphoinositide phosphatase FIG4 isoform X5 [Osmia lignaria lignaria]|uniref:polyphosphoinositide phosphatase FIG4 isoform X5 n=1 Tax=Osmia lignaria lignaria TaxID=1437193 RepID=UPI0014791B89|nr:polyphosphoinositide phosphatase isoform X5 [Osmia lignaria]
MDENIVPTVVFHPIISSIQKIALYETKSRFYLMGSNNTLTRFRVLKIDRMEPKELVVVDDKREYTQDEIKDLVNMIDMGNRTRAGQRNNVGGVARIVSAFGIVGNTYKEPTSDSGVSEASEHQKYQKPLHKPTQTKFTWKTMWQRDTFPRLVPAFGLLGFVRFLEGYYIILVTKRRKVAVIGHHTIYKIEDTSMIYIPNDNVRVFHPDEQRYVKMFQSIDLSSNFYFSYSYDLTHTLQSNMTPPKHIKSDISTTDNKNLNNETEDAEDFFNMWSFKKDYRTNSNTEKHVDYGVRSNPHRRFVWNSHLLKPVEKDLYRDWVLYVIHGFIGQSNVSIFGRSMYVTIIARRSNKYAGTRFLKRGANFDGDVANEVETEQIVHDSGVSSLSKGRFSTFVQMRGSVPGHWSQDVSKMVPKPTITCDLADPYVETAGAHFNQLLKRYGSPIIILNLVKKREKKKHESTLSEELSMAVKYLNQFLPPEHHIQYISFDMARMNKRKTAPWTSQGNDIMQTLSRYYSNTFSDQEKQHTINLFLGLFIPEEGKPPIWELLTDYYLHHKPACQYYRRTKLLTQWWDTNVLKCLPYALNEVTKSCLEMIQVENSMEEMIDVYYDYHRPYELSLLSEVYAYQISHSVRDFMPHFTTSFSPFAVRVRPGRRREETGNKNLNMKNPSMTGQSSTSSTTSSASSSDDSSSDDDESHQHINDCHLTTSKESSEFTSFETLFPSMKEVYGTQPEYPKRNDVILYKKFVLIGRNATYPSDYMKLRSKLIQQASFPETTTVVVTLPVIKKSSINIYEEYVERAKTGGSIPNANDINLYETYTKQHRLLKKSICSY